MNVWLQRLSEQPDDLTPCNSAGCAMGAATLIPEFKEAGLTTSPPNVHTFNYGSGCTIVYEGQTGYSAASCFFDIPYGSATYLFSPEEYNDPSETSPRTVADRIRKFVARQEA